MNRWLTPAKPLTLLFLLLLFITALALPGATGAQTQDLIITGVIDGPLTGGTPKAVELYVANNIADLSAYGLGSANNAGGTDGVEYTFPVGAVTADTFIYVATEAPNFTTFFGFAPTYTSGAVSINGDDAIELFYNNGTEDVVIDVFGDIAGTNTNWNYQDGWAYRKDGTGPEGATFNFTNWTYSAPNALDGETSNASAATPFPTGTYSPIATPVCPGAIPIADVQGPGPSTPIPAGQAVTVHGLVTAVFGPEIIVQEDSSAPRSGIRVYAPGNSNAQGDEVCVTGVAVEYYEMTQIKGDSNVTLTIDTISSGNALPAPVVLATGAIADEDWESVLVRVENLTVDDADLGYGEWSVNDTSGPARIGAKGNYTYTPVFDDELDFVQGPLYYSFDNYKIEARDDDDIGLPGACVGAIPIADVQGPGPSTPIPAGQAVTVHGLVTAIFGPELIVQEDSSTARSGIRVYAPGHSNARGDEVCVTGVAVEYYEMTQIKGDSNVTLTIDTISSGNALQAPVVLATGAVANEDWESVLVRVENVAVDDADLGYGEWSVNDTSGPARIGAKGNYTYTPVFDDELDFVQGPLYYSFDNYKIEARDDDDIVLAGSGTPQPVISEIMYDPASSEDNWEWIEVYNAGGLTLNLAGWVVDDINSLSHSAANIAGGSISAGETGILFNVDDVSAADFEAAWGTGINLIPVSGWSKLALNNGGDQIGLWDSFSSYDGDHRDHSNTVEDVIYTDDPPWPNNNNSASIFLTDLSADNNVGGNWALSTVGGVTPAFTGYQSTAGGGNSGGDIGSPADYEPPVVEACGDAATLIHAVQGPDDASPIAGDTISIEGVVVGDFQGADELEGFFVQEEIADFDADPATSEGIFVFQDDFAAPDVAVGDLVRVRGQVAEYKTLTEIKYLSDVLICADAPGPYAAVDVTLPEATDGDLEKVEGMLVNVTNTMSVAQNYFVGQYGQLTLSSDLSSRLFQPTNQVLPNTPASAAIADANARKLLFLDDGMDVSPCGDNPDPVPYLGYPPAILRAGDEVSSLTGVLDYGQINTAACYSSSTLDGRDYRLHPTQAPTFTPKNNRTAAPADVGGSLKVVSFNVLNFFNGDGAGGGFPTSRGADTYDEFVRQRIKIYEALEAIDGDIVGVMEIESDGYGPNSAIAELVKIMNEGPCYDTSLCTGGGMGEDTYAFIDASGMVNTDAIAVGFIYKTASVTPVGPALVVDEPAFTNPNNLSTQKNRPAIAQTFSDNEGGTFTAIVNHLKSKGSGCGSGDDDPEQGSCNDTRLQAARYLIDTVVPAVQTASGDPDVMIMGDLNAYAMEDPIREIEAGGFTNLIKLFNGPSAYSYVFDGLVGYLDHSLANGSLTDQVTGVTDWHINADEPNVMDYNVEYNGAPYYSQDAYRSSDHDPVIVGLDLNAPPSCASAVPSPEELWPVNHRFVPVSVGVTDPDGDAVTVTITGIWQDEPVLGPGSGNTAPDGRGVGTSIAELRAERAGNGNGRAYHVYFTASDPYNNSCSAEVIVFAPKSQGRFNERTDDGALYDSTVMP